MKFDLIVVRQSMLAEYYGAYLWQQQTGSDIMVTSPITKLTEDDLLKIKDKKILIVGGYYRENMEPIVKSAKEVSVFYNNSDIDGLTVDYTYYTSRELTGFLTWTVNQLALTEPYILQMAQYLDEYLYGYPTEQALCFQNGVYILEGNNDLDKILKVKSLSDIEQTIIKGREKRVNNLRVAQSRLKLAKEYTITFNGCCYEVLIGIGDTPIVDTCLLLAEKSKMGIGMLLRYDFNLNRTYVSTRTTENSGIDAGNLMKLLIKGGGSKPMGGGSVEGLYFPDQLIKLIS